MQEHCSWGSVFSSRYNEKKERSQERSCNVARCREIRLSAFRLRTYIDTICRSSNEVTVCSHMRDESRPSNRRRSRVALEDALLNDADENQRAARFKCFRRTAFFALFNNIAGLIGPLFFPLFSRPMRTLCTPHFVISHSIAALSAHFFQLRNSSFPKLTNLVSSFKYTGVAYFQR